MTERDLWTLIIVLFKHLGTRQVDIPPEMLTEIKSQLDQKQWILSTSLLSLTGGLSVRLKKEPSGSKSVQ
jgi:hypothetical protein